VASPSPIIVWFRQDLRLADQPALSAAAAEGAPVAPVYVLDEEGEGAWSPGAASRWRLGRSLAALAASLEKAGSRLTLRRGRSLEVLLELAEETGAKAVYWNRRYEPAVRRRDTEIKKRLSAAGLRVRSFNGSLLHSPLAVETKAGEPFKVFTPFWRRLRELGARAVLEAPSALSAPSAFPKSERLEDWEWLARAGWSDAIGEVCSPGEAEARKRLETFASSAAADYATSRDVLGEEDGVSLLSPYLHFGEISPVVVWRRLQGDRAAEPFLRQIAWREFAYHLLYHFPDTPEKPLRPAFEKFPWRRDETALKAWQRGQTGVPLVDAGLRQLWRAGWMRNRVRMVTASFLTKNLMQPWQAGARWFWDALVDADLANNTLGWQWVAGCGADAAPFFRIFNPVTQGRRFDPDGAYVRRWVPELAGLPASSIHQPWEAPPETLRAAGVALGANYPRPIVDLRESRARALAAYREMTGKSGG